MLNPRKLYNKKGFSLVELIIVIAIIAILSVVMGTQAPKWIASARKSSVLSTVTSIGEDLYTEVTINGLPSDDKILEYGVTAVTSYTAKNSLTYTEAVANKSIILFRNTSNNSFIILGFYSDSEFVVFDSTLAGNKVVEEPDTAVYVFTGSAS